MNLNFGLGDYEAALSILNSFDRRYPGYAAISLRKIGLSRRKATSDKYIFIYFSQI